MGNKMQGVAHKLIWSFIHHRNLFTKGSELIYWVIKWGQIWVMAEILVKLNPDMKITPIIRLGVALICIIGAWFVGWIWYRKKIFEMETEWSNKINPFVKEMREKIK